MNGVKRSPQRPVHLRLRGIERHLYLLGESRRAEQEQRSDGYAGILQRAGHRYVRVQGRSLPDKRNGYLESGPVFHIR